MRKIRECQNCGIDKPLKRNHCEACICLRCKKTAFEVGRINDMNWCESCEQLLQSHLLKD